MLSVAAGTLPAHELTSAPPHDGEGGTRVPANSLRGSRHQGRFDPWLRQRGYRPDTRDGTHLPCPSARAAVDRGALRCSGLPTESTTDDRSNRLARLPAS